VGKARPPGACTGACTPGESAPFAGTSESRMRLPTSHGYAETAWLRGSGVPGVPEMLVACLPRCLPGDRLRAVRVYAVVSEQMIDEALELFVVPTS
jgi:hypothetical protein